MIPFLLNYKTCRLTRSDGSRSGVAWGQGGCEGSVRGTRKPWGSWPWFTVLVGVIPMSEVFQLVHCSICNLLHINYTSIKLLNKFHCPFQIPCCLSQGFCLHAKETTMSELIQTIACPYGFPRCVSLIIHLYDIHHISESCWLARILSHMGEKGWNSQDCIWGPECSERSQLIGLEMHYTGS